MYFAGPTLSKALEKFADQKGKSIDLDSRVIFGKDLEKAFNGKDSGIMPKQIQEEGADDSEDSEDKLDYHF